LTGVKVAKAIKYSDEFVEWGGPQGHNAIYYNQGLKRYSSVLSDLERIDFETLEEIREWLKVGRFRED
jgi:hypothetical protein